jgi:hypothetical protein
MVDTVKSTGNPLGVPPAHEPWHLSYNKRAIYVPGAYF